MVVNLVFLHGRAAAGKLTTARCLAGLVGYPVFHNHLVVDLLTPIFPFGSEPFIRLREQFWLTVFAEAAQHDRSLIFTFTPEHTIVSGFAQRARDAVESHGGTVVFVRLAVGVGEQERRVIDPIRSGSTRWQTKKRCTASPARRRANSRQSTWRSTLTAVRRTAPPS